MRRKGRWLVAAALAVVAAVLAGAALRAVQDERPPAPVRVAAEPAPGSVDFEDLRTSRGIPLRVEPPLLPPELRDPSLYVVPAAPGPPQPMEIAPDVASGARPGTSEPLEVAAGGSSTDGAGTDPFLRVREYVQPEVPERIVASRKIDATVVVQVKVGTDGRVQDVRLLRSIPDCRECNKSAVAAAWRLVYEAPVAGPVWAAPFEMRFTHGRGR